MLFFNNPSEKKKAQILILGSYFPNKIDFLGEIKIGLREEGFSNTFLAKDLINPPNDENIEINSYFYSRVEDLMLNFDYNIFILFEENNDSVLIEFATFLKSPKYSLKKDRCIVIFPNNYNISMLLGIIEQQEVKTFRYRDRFEILEYCKRFILLN